MARIAIFGWYREWRERTEVVNSFFLLLLRKETREIFFIPLDFKSQGNIAMRRVVRKSTSDGSSVHSLGPTPYPFFAYAYISDGLVSEVARQGTKKKIHA